MNISSISATPIVVDGALVSEQSDTTSTAATVVDDQLVELMQQLHTSTDTYGQMMIVGFGLVVGILLVSLVRWWK